MAMRYKTFTDVITNYTCKTIISLKGGSTKCELEQNGGNVKISSDYRSIRKISQQKNF